MSHSVLQARYRKHPAIVGRKFEDEMVLLSTARGVADLDAVYVLNAVAQDVWSGLDGETTVGAIVRGIVERYEVAEATAAEDVTALVIELERVGVIEAAHHGGGNGFEAI